MITDFASYKEYFKTITSEHARLESYVFGGSQRILSRELSDITYPCLWLEVPDIIPFSGASDLRLRFSGGIMILQSTPQDFEEEDAAMNSTFTIAVNILQRLIDDAEAGLFDFDPRNAVLQAKLAFSGDNDHGWHLDFDLSISADDCLNENDWN